MPTMRLCILWVVPLLCVGCLSPKDRYVRALQLRQVGDAQGYFAELVSIAHSHPETRAGRRARVTMLSGNPGWALVGAAFPVLGGALPVGLSRVTEGTAQRGLLAIQATQERCKLKRGRYCRRAWEFRDVIDRRDRYTYFLGTGQAIGGEGVKDIEGFRLHAVIAMDTMKIAPQVTGKGFLVVAAANLDGDPVVDLWTLDHHGTIVHVIDDRF